MKKAINIGGIVLSLVLVIALSTGCGIKITEEQAYSDAQKKVNFQVLKPMFVPEDLNFSSVEYEGSPEGKGKIQGFKISYYSTDRKGVTLSVRETFLPHEARDKEFDPSQAQIEINGEPALITPTQQGYHIEWFGKSSVYTIEAHGLSSDEAIKIARSMKSLD